VVGCWRGYLSGARCRLAYAQLMPLPLTVSCFSKIQIGFTFLVPAHPGGPGKGPINGCVCWVEHKTLTQSYLACVFVQHRGYHAADQSSSVASFIDSTCERSVDTSARHPCSPTADQHHAADSIHVSLQNISHCAFSALTLLVGRSGRASDL